TGTCSTVHVPSYLEHRDALLAKGVDEIAVLSVNDAFVMDAWAKSTDAEGKIRFLADWDGAFTKAVGQDIDLSAGTLGVRSKRYSMLIEDGVVKAINVEENPGAVAVSGADTMLEQL
ncbi:MAG: redoxin family protein, partial [Pseudomonadota bacterium]